ncbi:DJ-1/PfpI family protein [Caldalkalibacillus salinus]|uniref:DJ-1/PfpI family protein n=1 Tax=Caldalkalibacillus salinus TaxID=2803787 RepID=UPI001924E5FC|nr:DJ-1/PfpI family protein [Caldalkalibacillus salinus]
MDVAIVAFDDFTDIDVFLPWDLLNRVNQSEWEVHIYGTKDFHRSVTGLTIPVHRKIEQLTYADAVLFASGPGTRALYKDEAYLRRIKLEPSTQLIGSMCSGALILGALGLLDGKTATTYPSAKKALQKFGVQVVEHPIVVEDRIATAAGCLAAQDLVGWMIQTLLNDKVKDAVLRSIQPVGQGLKF